jgi:ABC-type dipeptide/oligopeptide/nickel transport system permease component
VTGAASFPAFIARRLALLALTLVLVPSLSFVMFTLIQGDHTAPLDVLEELGSYLAAVFLQGELGSETFGGDTFVRTRSALDVVMDGFLVDLYLLAGAIGLAVLVGLAAGALQATRTARGKGVTGRRVVFRHALPAAAGPVVSLVAVNMNVILTNLALIETVFNIPGGFRYVERALVNRDVDLVQALVVEATLFIVLANFIADAIHAWLDPRIRTGGPT